MYVYKHTHAVDTVPPNNCNINSFSYCIALLYKKGNKKKTKLPPPSTQPDQVGNQRLIPYNAIATIRKLRINRKSIRSRHDRSKWHKQKGINRNNLQDIFISENIISKPNTQCKIGTINAHSIRNKDTLLAQEINTSNIDLTLIMETWLNDTSQDTAWLHQSDLIQSGYTISMHNRPSRGGRIALLYKDSMKVKKIEAQHLCTIEYALWQVSQK